MNHPESRYSNPATGYAVNVKVLWGVFRFIAVFLLLMLFLLCFSGCRHRRFTMPATSVEVNVVYDWGNSVTTLPKQMSLYLFPVDDKGAMNGSVLRFDSANPRTQIIRVAPGAYHAICINSDIRGTYIRGGRFEEFLVTTQENNALLAQLLGVSVANIPRVRGTEKEKVVELPDLLYSDRLASFPVRIPPMGQYLSPTLLMKPRKVTTTIHVHIDEIKNMKYVTSLNGSLTGLATGISLSGPVPTAIAATLPFAIAKRGSGASATFESFGPAGGNSPKRHILTVYAVLDSGERYYGEYDVTDQVLSAPNPLDLTIHIPLLELPTPIYSGGESQVQVENWKEVIVPVPM